MVSFFARVPAWLVLTLGAGGLGVEDPAQATAIQSSVLAHKEASQSPAARRARQLIAILNEADALTARAYLEGNLTPEALRVASADERLEGLGIRRYLIGQARFVRFEAKTATSGDIIFKSSRLNRLQKLSLEVEAAPPHRIAKIGGLPETVPGMAPIVTTDQERARIVHENAVRLAAENHFSGVVALARGDRNIFQQAYGLAERRFGVPNSVQTRFYSASIGKTFTAIAVAQLVQQGRLSWDTRLQDLLPEFAVSEAGSRIQIKHLLAHSSGLGDAYPHGFKIVPDALRSVADFLAIAPRKAPEFEPGTRYRYSNAGYLLLGRIVELTSGKDYYDYIDENVFRPAGMTGAGTASRDHVPERLAYGYEPTYSLDEPGFRDNSFILAARASPFGGAYLTATDLLRLTKALRSGTLLTPATWKLMTAPKPELGAAERGYGLGVGQLKTQSGQPVWGHGGNTSGACTSWGTVEGPGEPFTFVILSNLGFESCRPLETFVLETL